MKNRIGLAAAVFALAAASSARENPLLTRSTLPFQAPPFDKIQVSDYQPAIEEGMKQQLAEVAAIAADQASPTFANTIEAMERSGELLTRSYKVFLNVEHADTNPALQKIKSDLAPKISAHNDAIYMNPKLYARVQAIYDKRDSLGLDPEAKYLVERYRLFFVRSGANLGAAEKAKLSKLNEEIAELSSEYGDKLLAETNAAAVVVDKKADLAGLPEGDLAAAANAAKDKKMSGKWLFPMQNTTQQPPLVSLENRALRQRMLAASMARGDHGGPNDTKATVVKIAALRAEKAKLLGFATWADYVLDDQMAKTPANAESLLTRLVPPATAKARGEAAAIQKQIDAAEGGFQVTAADWDFYSEKVRKAEYDLDDSEIRPYLDLERVLQDGVFFAATKMYGITFKERKDIPVYHPDVRVWEVFDADGSSLALYYGDFYLRPSKGGGAWCDSFVDQSRLLGWKPAITNNTNFTKPAPGEPALISSTNMETLFHEFGHALHGIFQNVQYPTLGSTPRDFVEFPSAFNEHWAYEPTVLANYAKHAKTGEPMPAALVEKIKKTRTFNQGYITTEYLASALLDMAWHSQARRGDAAGRQRVREGDAREGRGQPPRGAAPLPHDLLLARLVLGLRRGLLRLLLVRGPRQGRLLLVQGERRHDAEERRPLPRDDPLARRQRGCRGDVPRVPRPRSRDPAAARRARPDGNRRRKRPGRRE